MAHHHAHPASPDADAAGSTPPAPVSTTSSVREAQCAPASGRGCGEIRSALATPGSRAEQDAVALAAVALTPVAAAPPPSVRPRPSAPPLRPPGSGPAPLPLRI
jgi:hypothetical protein